MTTSGVLERLRMEDVSNKTTLESEKERDGLHKQIEHIEEQVH
jgi:hypothetical protein